MKKALTFVILGALAFPLIITLLFGAGALALFGAGSGTSGDGSTITIPEEYGNGGYSVTCYDDFDGRWASGTGQEEMCNKWHEAGAVYTDGIATINGRYLLACTEKYGACGDYVTFKLADGTEIPGIIADVKNSSDPGCNEWGHNDGQNIIEFEVKRSFFVERGNPGNENWYPQWAGKRVASCTKSSNSSIGSGIPGCSSSIGGSPDGYLGTAMDIARDDSHGYTLGATGPDEFDCQGLVKYSLSQNGYDTTPWGFASDGSGTGAAATGLIAMGFTEHKFKNEADLQPGDILLYHYTGTGNGHVAIYVGDGKIVEAIGNKDGKPGDSSGQEIRIGPDWAKGIWQTYYRDERVTKTDKEEL